MKYLIIFLFSFLFAGENFVQYKNTLTNEYFSYKNNLEKEFTAYKNELNKEFDLYKKELAKNWNNPEVLSKKKYVSYSKDLKIRQKVDFEKKYIEIDVISSSLKKAKKKIAKSLLNLTLKTTKEAYEENPVLKKVDNKFKNIALYVKPENRPIVTDLIFKKPPNEREIKNFVVKNLKNRKITVKKSKIKNNYVYSIKIPLPKTIYLIKAREYKPLVFGYGRKYKVFLPLIFAVIETESAYNPMATSYVPAFGLMQIVPKTAGMDVTKTLYGKPKLVTGAFLFNAKNNILFGSVYLHKLFYDYFRGVKDPLSRLYLTIAAYNTGPGNVACAFNSTQKDFKGRVLCYRFRGDYSIKKALKKINSMTPNEVYYYLIKNLKYDEAKNYLKKVSYRMKTYYAAMKNSQI